jgi:hypothetical protein
MPQGCSGVEVVHVVVGGAIIVFRSIVKVGDDIAARHPAG